MGPPLAADPAAVPRGPDHPRGPDARPAQHRDLRVRGATTRTPRAGHGRGPGDRRGVRDRRAAPVPLSLLRGRDEAVVRERLGAEAGARPAQGTRGTSGRRANASMNRPIIFVAATRSSIRMFSSGAWARQSARPAPSVVAGTRCCGADLVHRHGARERDADARLIPVDLARDGGRGLDDRVGRRRPPGGLGLAHDHVDVAEPVLVEVAAQRVDHDPRVLVRDEPDVEPRVRLGRGHRLGRRVRVPGPQALEVEGRRERQRVDGVGAVDARR